MFQSDGEDDDGGNATVTDKRSSFDFKCDDDDNVNLHLKKWRCHDDLAVTINDAAPWLPDTPLLETSDSWVKIHQHWNYTILVFNWLFLLDIHISRHLANSTF